MVFIWGDIGYPAVRFHYKTATELYMVAGYKQNGFGCFKKNSEFLYFQKTPNPSWPRGLKLVSKGRESKQKVAQTKKLI